MNLLKSARPLCFHLGIAALFDLALFVRTLWSVVVK